LTVVKKHAASVMRTKKNRYEFPGIRKFWELGCQAQAQNRTRDLFLYFHAKGTSYNVGRSGLELVMTSELIANWRPILNLIGTAIFFDIYRFFVCNLQIFKKMSWLT
jgi:hypothetical protein